MRLRNLIGLAVTAGALILASAVAFGEELDPNTICSDGQCYRIVNVVRGRDVDQTGGNIIIAPIITPGTGDGTEQLIGRVIEKARGLGEQVGGTPPFTYNPSPLLLTGFLNPATVDFNTLPAASPQPRGNDRQPKIVFDAPSARGSPTQHPTVNIVRELAAKGKPLAENQVQWLRETVAQKGAWIPGELIVSMFLKPGPAGKWVVSNWNYTFVDDLTLALQGMPPPECPPGSPAGATWPGCKAPPPPPPPDQCPRGMDWDVTKQECIPPPQFCPPGWGGNWPDCTPPPPPCLPDYVWDPKLNMCVPKPPQCPSCGPIDPYGEVILVEPQTVRPGGP